LYYCQSILAILRFVNDFHHGLLGNAEHGHHKIEIGSERWQKSRGQKIPDGSGRSVFPEARATRRSCVLSTCSWRVERTPPVRVKSGMVPKNRRAYPLDLVLIAFPLIRFSQNLVSPKQHRTHGTSP
jgi:hypothetical protein